MPEWLSFFYF